MLNIYGYFLKQMHRFINLNISADMDLTELVSLMACDESKRV